MIMSLRALFSLPSALFSRTYPKGNTAMATDEPIDLDPPPYPDAYVVLGNSKTYSEEAVYGVGQAHLGSGLRFLFERWTTVESGDYFAVRIRDLNNPIHFETVRDETQVRYEMTIKKTLPEGTSEFFGRVVRAGSGNAIRSITQKILIKTTAPGGEDNEPFNKWHSGLSMRIVNASTRIPIVDGSLLNDSAVSGGLIFLIDKYRYCRTNDVITIEYEGRDRPFEYVVSPADEAGSGPIEVLMAENDIPKDPDQDSVSVYFWVKDVVGNRAKSQYWFSKPFNLTNDLGDELLPQPAFTRQPAGTSEAESVETDLVDLDTDSTAKFAVEATVERLKTPPKIPRKIQFILVYTSETGVSTSEEFPPITDTNRGREKLFIDFEKLNKQAGRSFRVYFKLFTQAGVKRSASTLVMVVGREIWMPPVISAQAEEGIVDPTKVLSSQIPEYRPHDSTWREIFTLKLLEASGGINTYNDAQFAGPPGGTRNVSVLDLQKFAGKGYVGLSYSTDEGRENATAIRHSKVLITQIGTRDPELEAPIVQGVVDNNIDPKKIIDPEFLMNIPYEGTAIGNVLKFAVIGRSQAASTSGSITITKASAGSGLPSQGIPLPRSVLDLNNETIISFVYSVIDNSVKPAKVLRSKVLDVSVGKALKPDIPKVIEAGTRQDQINPKDVLNGANVEVSIKNLWYNDQGTLVTVHWRGRYGISSIDVPVVIDPDTNKASAFIPPNIIALGIRPSPNTFSVSYHFNLGPFEYRSVTRDLKLLAITGLPTPSIDDFKPGILPLYELKESARYLTKVWDFFEENQYAWFFGKGTYSDGSPYEVIIRNGELVSGDGATYGICADVLVDEIRKLKEGSHFTLSLRVSYAQIPDPDTAVPFEICDYVIQTLPAILPAPAFAGKVGAQLTIDPLAYENTASVTVTYPGMSIDPTAQTVALEWIHQNGTVSTIPPQKGDASGKLIFSISARILADSVGNTITLRYTSTKGGKTTTSEVQTLIVQTISLAKLPRPIINGITNGGKLDIDNYTQNAFSLALPIWPLIFVDQKIKITLHCLGVLPLTVLDNHTLTAAQVKSGLANIPVLRTWLQALPNNSAVEVNCEVAFDGKPDNPRKVKFPTTSYAVITLQTLVNDTTTLQNFSFNGWQPGTAVADYRDLSFSAAGLLNYTYSSQSAGPVLRKSFYNMRVGARYFFGIHIRREDGRYSLPLISLYTNQGIHVPATYIGSMAYIQLGGYFIANTSTMEFMIYSNNSDGNGNDYRMANLVVVRQ